MRSVLVETRKLKAMKKTDDISPNEKILVETKDSVDVNGISENELKTDEPIKNEETVSADQSSQNVSQSNVDVVSDVPEKAKQCEEITEETQDLKSSDEPPFSV